MNFARWSTSLEIAWSHLRTRRGQTYVLSAAIGSSVALITIVGGLMQSATAFASASLGPRNGHPLVSVVLRRPRNQTAFSAGSRFQDDLEAVRSVLRSDGKATSEEHSAITMRGLGGEVLKVDVFGVSEDWFGVRSVVIRRGRVFTPREFGSRSAVGIVSSRIAVKLFGIRDPLDKTVRLAGRPLRIVGIIGPLFLSSEPSPLEDVVLVPSRSEFVRRLEGDKFTLYIDPGARAELSAVAGSVGDALRVSHRLPPLADDDFSIFFPGRKRADFWGAIGTSFNLAGLALTMIALVGSGILLRTAMYVAVNTRRFEIGIRRAVGAKRNDILAQFALETLSISLLGGVLGLLAGEGILLFVGFFYRDTMRVGLGAPWPALASVFLLALFGGFQPARRASHLNPIDALRG